jgi:tRNA nucleotidyltransferase (CCA-adding enzyme)
MHLSLNNIPDEIHKVCELFHSNNFQVFLVGGSIRDLLRGKTRPNDWDLATDALPSEVMFIFGKEYRVIPTGLKHGTITLLFGNMTIEITTFRIEGDYLDGRHPEEVSFVSNIEEDLSRRDLTINAIAYDLIKKELVDPFNGANDIQDKIVRLVGDPAKRLEEDGLRLIRIFRFISQLGFTVEEKTLQEVQNHFETFNLVALERVQNELQKLMVGSYWKDAIRLMNESGLLIHVLPEFQEPNIQESTGIGINRLDITLKLIEYLSTDASINLRFASLFHQISAVSDKKIGIFPEFNEKIVKNTLRRMKFPNKQINSINHLLTIHNIPFPYNLTKNDEEKKNYLTRRLLYRVKPEYFSDYLLFLQAKEKILPKDAVLNKILLKDIRTRSKVQKPIYLRDLKVDGNEIVSQLSIDKSKSSQKEFISLSLDILRERVELNPGYNSKGRLYEIITDIKRVMSLCTLFGDSGIIVVSTDHVRKLYRDGTPEYSAWENSHTYKLATWLVKCILQKKRSTLVMFDATNLNSAHHPSHRETVFRRFRNFNPIFVHLEATDNEAKLNIISREEEKESLIKSDADLTIFKRYKEVLTNYPRALGIPAGSQMVKLGTRSPTYTQDLKRLVQEIKLKNHRLIILSGNVLTGKTYTAMKLEGLLKTSYGKTKG